MYKISLTVSMLIGANAQDTHVPCDYPKLAMNAYTDPECTTLDEAYTAEVLALQDLHADKQTAQCEYLGDDVGYSYISRCNSQEWWRTYYVGGSNDGGSCTEEGFIQDDIYQWNACKGPDYFGMYLIATTIQEFDDADSAWTQDPCDCLGYDNLPTYLFEESGFTDEYGSYCYAWDAGQNPDCFEGAEYEFEDWCSWDFNWCYVEESC